MWQLPLTKKINFGVNYKRPSNFKDDKVFSFWGIEAGSLVDDSFFLTKKFHDGVNKFTTIVRSKDLDGFLELSLDHGMEHGKLVGNLGFMFQEVNPCHLET